MALQKVILVPMLEIIGESMFQKEQIYLHCGGLPFKLFDETFRFPWL